MTLILFLITAGILTVINWYICFNGDNEVKKTQKKLAKLDEKIDRLIIVLDAKDELHDHRLMELENKVEVDSQYSLKLFRFTMPYSRFVYDRHDRRVVADSTHQSIRVLVSSVWEDRVLELCETPKSKMED